jgi:hypothetical protein
MEAAVPCGAAAFVFGQFTQRLLLKCTVTFWIERTGLPASSIGGTIVNSVLAF